MSDKSKIQWTDATWSPIRARVKTDAPRIAMLHGWKDLAEICEKMKGHVGPHCEFVSSGCNHCYSCTNNHRCLPSNGTGLPFDKRSRELVDIFLDEKILMQPLKWRSPKKVFVENQSDLFGEWVPSEMIDKVFAVMALCPQHTFQVLTKRPERMREYFERPDTLQLIEYAKEEIRDEMPFGVPSGPWPLPNVWLGVSVEDQQRADQRIPLLLQTPAAVRFVSYEPALGPVDFKLDCIDIAPGYRDGFLHKSDMPHPCEYACGGIQILGGIDWIIVGGESGPGARVFDIEWAVNVIKQCHSAGVSCFIKQLGAFPIWLEDGWRLNFGGPSGRVRLLNARKSAPNGYVPLKLSDGHGGNPAEWPERLQVRQFPEVRA